MATMAPLRRGFYYALETAPALPSRRRNGNGRKRLLSISRKPNPSLKTRNATPFVWEM